MIYIIDDADRINHLDNEWLAFAEANGGTDLAPQQVIGHPLWSFIQGFETKHLYKLLLRRVRRGERIQFSLRCDSPTTRRWLKMRMQPFAIGCVIFETEEIKTEERERIPLLVSGRPVSDEILLICDWCGRLRMTDGDWVEAEEAMARLGLFGREVLPQLVHGICEDCYRKTAGKAPSRFDDPSARLTEARRSAEC